MNNKKAVHPVIATALLLVVAVITLVLFNIWFSSYSSNLMADVETQSSINAVAEIETVIGDFVYIKTPSNLTIDRILVDGNECETNVSMTQRMQGVNISSCLSDLSSSTPKITLITDNNIVTESVYLKDAVIGSSVDSTPTIVETDGNFNLLSNGIVTCNGAIVGEIGELASKNYTAVSNQNLSDMIGSNNISFYETVCTSLVTDMNVADSWDRGVFYNANINPNISHWDTSSVTDMSSMFVYASNFNQSLNSWDVSQVTNMNSLFQYASSFNGDISSWNVSNVDDMYRIFYEANSFNGDISNWNVSKITDMSSMFEFASNFNQNINSWDTSKVIDMGNMFYMVNSFNQSLSNWNTSNVIDMGNMFSYASSFNGDISSWDVSNVTSMVNMFAYASSFDGDIGSWNTSKVLDMRWMFSNAVLFNHNLNSWDVNQVTTCTGFNQTTTSWQLSNQMDFVGQGSTCTP